MNKCGCSCVGIYGESVCFPQNHLAFHLRLVVLGRYRRSHMRAVSRSGSNASG